MDRTTTLRDSLYGLLLGIIIGALGMAVTLWIVEGDPLDRLCVDGPRIVLLDVDSLRVGPPPPDAARIAEHVRELSLLAAEHGTERMTERMTQIRVALAPPLTRVVGAEEIQAAGEAVRAHVSVVRRYCREDLGRLDARP